MEVIVYKITTSLICTDDFNKLLLYCKSHLHLDRLQSDLAPRVLRFRVQWLCKEKQETARSLPAFNS